MEPVDHSNTKVLLIGASLFPEDTSIRPIPNVQTNLTYLDECLTDPAFIGIPRENISVSLNENKIQIERRLNDLVEETRNKKFTLLVYYSGHGFLSPVDFQLYLTTFGTSKRYLKSDGISIETFKSYIRRSLAGRKIVILDCCHSGSIIGAMDDMPSQIQAGINGFEGTYVMTSAAEDTLSLFPEDKPDQPTYFTGKLLEVVKEGIEVDNEYCSLRNIFDKIESDFREAGLPRPQQSNFNNADQLFFSKNKKYTLKKSEDEIAWEDASLKNSKWGYISFKRLFPHSQYAEVAKKRVYEIEEVEFWNKAIQRNSLSAFDDYLDNYPNGKFAKEAEQKITGIHDEEMKWQGRPMIVPEPAASVDAAVKPPTEVIAPPMEVTGPATEVIEPEPKPAEVLSDGETIPPYVPEEKKRLSSGALLLIATIVVAAITVVPVLISNLNRNSYDRQQQKKSDSAVVSNPGLASDSMMKLSDSATVKLDTTTKK